MIVPAGRAGVRLDDDWDGMGQRLTASGTSHFDGVHVADDEVLPSPIGADSPTPRSAFLQLYLMAVMAGIVRNAASDAAALARGRTRTFSHGSGALPAQDPLVQEAVGRIDADAFAAETVVLAAADALDAADGLDPEALHEASLRAARAQVVVTASWRRARPSGCSTPAARRRPSRERNLDRHWRNVRDARIAQSRHVQGPRARRPADQRGAAAGQRLLLSGPRRVLTPG